MDSNEQRDISTETDEVSPQTLPAADEQEPPDGGYGWVCVAATFWINAHTWGINSV